MTASPQPNPPTIRAILGTVWPIVLANASTPLLGLTDTAVLGRTGAVEGLAAVALGSLIISFVYWAFGFLRMATTGFVAQADGADSGSEARAALALAVLMGVGLGLLLWVAKTPIAGASLALLDGTPDVEAIAAEYVRIRMWGAPAALATFALIGALVGLGASRRLLAVQVAINGLNIVLDVVLAGLLGLGAPGVALGTAIAEWTGLLLAGVAVAGLLRRRWPEVRFEIDWAAVADPARLRRTLAAQRDIMLRTVFLLGGFAWFTNQSARFGDATLAANHILLQLVSFSAFVLDGFAFATESLVGRAVGSGDRARFDHAVTRTTAMAALAALLLAGSVALFGEAAVAALTDLPQVRAESNAVLGYTAAYIAVSVGAFQLDGVFIGATHTRAMRNAALVSLAVFLMLSTLLVPAYENDGLWLAFIGYVVARAATLGALVPGLRRGVG